MKKCPYCAEEIQDEAILCRYCHSDVRIPPAPLVEIEPPKPKTEKCRYCSEEIPAGQVICKFCAAARGIELPEPEPEPAAAPVAVAVMAQAQPKPQQKKSPGRAALVPAAIFAIVGTIMSLGAGEYLPFVAAFIFAGAWLVFWIILKLKDAISN